MSICPFCRTALTVNAISCLHCLSGLGVARVGYTSLRWRLRSLVMFALGLAVTCLIVAVLLKQDEADPFLLMLGCLLGGSFIFLGITFYAKSRQPSEWQL